MMAGASAPSPFYPVLEREIGFSPATLTAIFAVYAVALLLTLLVTGSLSDHVGRRPVVSAAFALLAVSMLVFWHADSVAAARPGPDRPGRRQRSAAVLADRGGGRPRARGPARPRRDLQQRRPARRPRARRAGRRRGHRPGRLPDGRRLRRPHRRLRRARARALAAARDLAAPRRCPAVAPPPGRRPRLGPPGLRPQRARPLRRLGHRWALPLAGRPASWARSWAAPTTSSRASSSPPSPGSARCPASWPATARRARSRSTAPRRSPSAPP